LLGLQKEFEDVQESKRNALENLAKSIQEKEDITSELNRAREQLASLQVCAQLIIE